MGRSDQFVDAKETGKIRDFLVNEGQCLAGFVDVVEQARMGLDELIEAMGWVGIEAVLQLSAQGVAREKRRGKRGSDVLRYGSQGGEVPLRDRKIRVRRPTKLPVRFAPNVTIEPAATLGPPTTP